MSQSLSRRSFLKYAGSGAVSLAAALLTGVSGAALAPCYEGEPALLDGKAAVELLGCAPATIGRMRRGICYATGRVVTIDRRTALACAALAAGLDEWRPQEVKQVSSRRNPAEGL